MQRHWQHGPVRQCLMDAGNGECAEDYWENAQLELELEEDNEEEYWENAQLESEEVEEEEEEEYWENAQLESEEDQEEEEEEEEEEYWENSRLASGEVEGEEDPMLAKMPGLDFKAYRRADISSFYQEERGSRTEKKPNFTGQAGKFVNMSPERLDLYW